MPIIVHKFYVGSDLQRSKDNGYQANVRAEAYITVVPKGNSTEFSYAGLRIIEKKDGSGLTVVPPSQRSVNASGTNEYLNLYEIPKPWYEGVKAEVLAKYEKWAASGGESSDAEEELSDPFAEL